jgi:hypothetical protein
MDLHGVWPNRKFFISKGEAEMGCWDTETIDPTRSSGADVDMLLREPGSSTVIIRIPSINLPVILGGMLDRIEVCPICGAEK